MSDDSDEYTSCSDESDEEEESENKNEDIDTSDNVKVNSGPSTSNPGPSKNSPGHSKFESFERPKRDIRNLSNLRWYTYYDDRWSKEEKLALLRALNKYGMYDTRLLAEQVPSKQPAQIKKFIDSWFKKSRSSDNYDSLTLDALTKKYTAKGLTTEGRKQFIHTAEAHERVAPIEEWITGLLSAQPRTPELNCRYIAKAFRYYALFGDHPPPEQCNGVDFEALYTNLSRVLQGNPPLTMNGPSNFYFHQSIKMLQQLYYRVGVQNEAVLRDKQYQMGGKERVVCRQYRGKKPVQQNSKEEAELKFLGSTHYNPLRLNPQALQRKPLPKLLVKKCVLKLNSNPGEKHGKKRKRRYYHTTEYFSKR